MVKKGKQMYLGIEGWDDPVRLDDLQTALRRIDHDYVLVGRVCAYDPLAGEWVTDGGMPEVLRATRVAEPILFPADLLVLDGDVTGKTAKERFELMRSLVPIVGSHVIVPPQVECTARQDLDAAVDQVSEWAPAEREESWRCPGVTVVRADSQYTHGVSPDEVRLTFSVGKEFAFGAGPGVGTERPGEYGADEKKKPNFLAPEKRESKTVRDDDPDTGDNTDAGNPRRNCR